MPTLSERNYETPKSWSEFEAICKDAFHLRWSNPDLSMHGRQGQAQNGVDIYGYNSFGDYVGVQCKNTVDGISESVINSECVKAEKFFPAIKTLYIATTAKRDVHIQSYARKLSIERKNDGKFPVEIVFWEDVCSDLTRSESMLRKHYPESNVTPTVAGLVRKKDISNLLKLLSVFDVTNTLEHLQWDAKYVALIIKEQYDHIYGVINSAVFNLNDVGILQDTVTFFNDWRELMILMSKAPYRYNEPNKCLIFTMHGDICKNQEKDELFEQITSQMQVLHVSISNFCRNINANFHEIDLNETSRYASRLYP